MSTRGNQKVRVGKVLSNKMQKTIVVAIERRTLDQTFEKFMKKMNKIKVHDEKNECRVGDQVEIIETRPISREKSWRIRKILVKAVGAEGGTV